MAVDGVGLFTLLAGQDRFVCWCVFVSSLVTLVGLTGLCKSLASHRVSKLSSHAVTWALAAVVMDSMSIRRVALNLGAAWNTVNEAVLNARWDYLITDPSTLTGVTTIGVDEHCWSHTVRGDRYVTVIIDLTPRKEGKPARLLDMVPGRSKQALKAWLEAQTSSFAAEHQSCGDGWSRRL